MTEYVRIKSGDSTARMLNRDKNNYVDLKYVDEGETPPGDGWYPVEKVLPKPTPGPGQLLGYTYTIENGVAKKRYFVEAPEPVDMSQVRTFDQLKTVVGRLVGATAALLLWALPASAQTQFRYIDETNTIYTAAQTDTAIASLLASDTNHTAMVGALRLVVGDLWRRVDALDDADGSGYVTAAEVETIYAETAEAVAGRIYADISTNKVSFAVAQAAIAQLGDLDARYARLAPTAVNAATITSTAGQSIPLSQERATRRYRASGTSALTIASFTGLSQMPCWLVLHGYSSVNWPSGAVLVSGGYESGKVNYFRICQVYENTFIEKVSAQ